MIWNGTWNGFTLTWNGFTMIWNGYTTPWNGSTMIWNGFRIHNDIHNGMGIQWHGIDLRWNEYTMAWNGFTGLERVHYTQYTLCNKRYFTDNRVLLGFQSQSQYPGSQWGRGTRPRVVQGTHVVQVSAHLCGGKEEERIKLHPQTQLPYTDTHTLIPVHRFLYTYTCMCYSHEVLKRYQTSLIPRLKRGLGTRLTSD